MKLSFIKMQACGNDYIFIDCFYQTVKNPRRLAKSLSIRRFSIGSDGLVLICPSKKADAKMIMYNADGSKGKTCGNALRSIAKYLYVSGRIRKRSGVIETDAGLRRFRLDVKKGKVKSVLVAMGKASFEPNDIPINSTVPIIDAPLDVLGEKMRFSCVSVGNPHAVCFVDDIDKIDVERFGAGVNALPLFSGGVNVEFACVLSSDMIRVRVFERGSGITLSCGSGACAVGFVAAKLKKVAFNRPIAVLLDGGTLFVTVKNDYSLYLEGSAKIVYHGDVYVKDK